MRMHTLTMRYMNTIIYCITYQELMFEARVQASDRTKTPEEIAKNEKERLEELENDRLKRMKGETDADNSDDDESNGKSGNSKSSKKRRGNR
jgi:nucleolar protein 14